MHNVFVFLTIRKLEFENSNGKENIEIRKYNKAPSNCILFPIFNNSITNFYFEYSITQ
jgi:hypothetical protein